ncbi:MAG: hypothetical protein WCD35_17930 [Mycobacteriales bacterium]
MTDTVTGAPKSSMAAGVAAACVGALVGAALWAVLVSVSDYKIGYAAVGVGALAGLLAGRAGGNAPNLPVVAAAIGLVGCVIGDLLTDAHAVSAAVHTLGGSVSMFEVLRKMAEDPAGFGWDVYKEGFAPLDLVFYAFAAVAAFRLATRHGAPAPQQLRTWPAPTGTPVAQPTTPSVSTEPTPAPTADADADASSGEHSPA